MPQTCRCPKCGQAFVVSEIYDPMIVREIEQEIACPGCGAFISTMTSANKLVTLPAPDASAARTTQ